MTDAGNDPGEMTGVEDELGPSFDARRGARFIPPFLVFLVLSVARLGAAKVAFVLIPTMLVASTSFLVPEHRRRDEGLAFGIIAAAIVTGLVMLVLALVLGIGEA